MPNNATSASLDFSKRSSVGVYSLRRGSLCFDWFQLQEPPPLPPQPGQEQEQEQEQCAAPPCLGHGPGRDRPSPSLSTSLCGCSTGQNARQTLSRPSRLGVVFALECENSPNQTSYALPDSGTNSFNSTKYGWVQLLWVIPNFPWLKNIVIIEN